MPIDSTETRDGGSLHLVVGPVVGNGKSPLRTLLGQFVYLNPSRGITLDDAFLGTKCRGMKWERRQVATALNNMVNDKQITADWPDGKTRRYYPRPNKQITDS